jgi:beta-glucosidase
VTLDPGESAQVRFDLRSEHFSFIDIDMQRVAEPGLFDIMVGPHSADVDSVMFEYTK